MVVNNSIESSPFRRVTAVVSTDLSTFHTISPVYFSNSFHIYTPGKQFRLWVRWGYGAIKEYKNADYRWRCGFFAFSVLIWGPLNLGYHAICLSFQIDCDIIVLETQKSKDTCGWMSKCPNGSKTFKGVIHLLNLTSSGYRSKAGDCVLMRHADSSKPSYVAKVEKLESDAEGSKVKVHIQWYYRPEESIGGRREFHGIKEVFLSDHHDVQSADTIEGRCTVHTFKSYSKLDVVGNEEYFCRFEYNSSTGAFNPDRVAVYVLEKLYKARCGREDGVGSIIMSPTRELADQTFGVLKSVGKHHGLSVGLLIGGNEYDEEEDLVNGMNILICTPGRLLKHMDTTPNFDCSELQAKIEGIPEIGHNSAEEEAFRGHAPLRSRLKAPKWHYRK
ncbi:hypothetical protein LXL04_039009 [Taraxacum kok-saghyz]